MDSTAQSRAPGGDDRRRLTPRVERVELDRNDFSVAIVYFKDDMDRVFTRKPIGEFRLTTTVGSDWYIRYRETSSTFNWFWVDKRILRLTNPITVQSLPGAKNRLIYLSGNIRGSRRFHLRKGPVCERILEAEFFPPTIESVQWDDKTNLFTIKWIDEVDFQGGSGEIIVQSADGTQYWANDGSPISVESFKNFIFLMDGPFPGSILDSGFYQIGAGGFSNILSGKANDQIDSEWNA